MSECNAIIEANNEIDRLKRENKKLNALCVQYGFDMGRLDEENEQLKETIKELENAKHIGDGEWDIRDITYSHGKFRLEEWGERYHQFYDGDKQLEDEEVVSLLFENEQLKESNQEAIELIYDGIVEMHDGKRDYAEKLLNEAIELMTKKRGVE